MSQKTDKGIQDRRRILVHSPNQLVDLVFTVTSITTLHVMISLLLQATRWSTQLERPQEIVCFLEMGTHGHNLMDKIFNAYYPKLTQGLQQIDM